MPHIGRDIIPSHLSASSSTERYQRRRRLRQRAPALRRGSGDRVPERPQEPQQEVRRVQRLRPAPPTTARPWARCTTTARWPTPSAASPTSATGRCAPTPTPSTKQKGANGLGKGSKVLLLCLNGENNNAVILGGLRDQADVSGFGDKEAKDLGHYFHFNFNGVSADIDKDGQFTLVYNGKTEVDGTTKVDSSKVGTFSAGQGRQRQARRQGRQEPAHDRPRQLQGRDQARQRLRAGRGLRLHAPGPELPPGTAEDEQPAPQPHQHAQGPADHRRCRHDQRRHQHGDAHRRLPCGRAPWHDRRHRPDAGYQVAGQMATAIQNFEQAASSKNSFLSKKNKAD
jgi:hypothetical protein